MKNLKNVITGLLLVLSTTLISQVEMSHGIVVDEELSFNRVDELASSFKYVVNKDTSLISCNISDNGEGLERSYIQWDVVEYKQTEWAVVFLVVDMLGDTMILSFFKELNMVLIIADEDNSFSAMEGVGIDYNCIVNKN